MNKLGNALRAAALTAAITAPATTTAHAENAPTPAEAIKVIDQSYLQLRSRAVEFATAAAVEPNQPGAVSAEESSIPGGTSETIQSYAYDKPSRTLQGFFISLTTPDGQITKPSEPLPGSLFQITVSKGKHDHAEAPKTPEGFRLALNRSAARSAQTGYNFNIRKEPDGNWQATTSKGQLFTTGGNPFASPETAAILNMDSVNALTAQAGRILTAAIRHRALPKGHPADLHHTHPR